MKRRVAFTAACLCAGALTACSDDVDGSPETDSAQSPQSQGQPPAGEPAPPSGSAPPEEIDGVEHVGYRGGLHVNAPERVAYDREPPLGGAHDSIWAACNGVVYADAVRTEHLVHSLEHGAVWIAYDPDELDDGGVATLAEHVTGKPYTVMSPYPGLDKAVSLQVWGYQLKVDDPTDARVQTFVEQYRNHPDTPEPGASCDPIPGQFDVDDPPPFDPSEPGPDARPVDE